MSRAKDNIPNRKVRVSNLTAKLIWITDIGKLYLKLLTNGKGNFGHLLAYSLLIYFYSFIKIVQLKFQICN